MSAESSVGTRVRDRQALGLALFSLVLWVVLILRVATGPTWLVGDMAPVLVILQFGSLFLVPLVSLLCLVRAVFLAVIWRTSVMLVIAMASYGLLLALYVWLLTR